MFILSRNTAIKVSVARRYHSLFTHYNRKSKIGRWKWLVKIFSSGIVRVDKISFDLCIHGYGSWRDRAFIHEQIRKKMPEEMLVYDYDCTLFDIILTARETMLQSCVITFISMLILCILFIPSVRATAFVLLSMISVTTGLLHFHKLLKKFFHFHYLQVIWHSKWSNEEVSVVVREKDGRGSCYWQFRSATVDCISGSEVIS